MSQNSFGTASTLRVASADYRYYRLATLAETGVADVSRLPFSHRILLENLLRFEDGKKVSAADIRTLASGVIGADPKEISHRRSLRG
jgi:aconitate hydratase